MLNNNKCFNMVLLIVAILVVAPQPAHAYIDPGSGSYVLQVALASLFGFLFVLKSSWVNLKTMITSKFSKSRQHDSLAQQNKTR
jgi:hydrogenase-4 membrane subunit HyfE